MKRVFAVSLLVLCAFSASAQQVDWKRFDRMYDNGEYNSLYNQAKTVYDNSQDASQRFAAAFWMARTGDRYQEDAYDSAIARYRALLPSLDSLHAALCYAFLGSFDTALMYEQVLKRTPVTDVEHYFNGGKTLNVTPTVYDALVVTMLRRSH